MKRRYDPAFVLPVAALLFVLVLSIVGGVVTARAGAGLIAGWLP